MIRRPPRSTRTDTLFPYTTLFRSRLTTEDLQGLFGRIVAKEGVSVAPEALAMIARAADGSARDGLSLLDQAIALGGGTTVEAAQVQAMLGLVDRARIFDLFEALVGGTVPESPGRSEEGRVGKEVVSTLKSWWAPYHYKK